MATVELIGVRKHFGSVRAVDGVDLTAQEGEFLVLLGPSGCGKTTLLRMIAGLERPTAGEIRFDGQVVNHLPPRARRVAMVFQSYALYPHMSVFDNIAFPLRAVRMPRERLRERVEWAAKMFGIAHLLQRKPRELSGGERQRVALARAMVREPTVFLLDEPLSNLDAKLRASARDELKGLQRRIGITTIYVTHDQVEALGMGDRIVVMNQGRVQQVGTPQEVYEQPANTFVATFLGSPPMNLLHHPRAGVVIGFRPEHFLPKEVQARDHAEADLVTFPFRVKRVEYLGADRLLYGTIEGPELQEKTAIIAKLPFTMPVAVGPGEVGPFAVPRRALCFFDPETGERVAEPPRPLALAALGLERGEPPGTGGS